MNILVVEDSPVKQWRICEILKNYGYENYNLAMYGIEALEMFEANEYQLVILDLGFNWFETDGYSSTNGVNLFYEFVCRKNSMLDIIIFSETTLSSQAIEEMNSEGLYAKVDNSEELKELLDDYFHKDEKRVLIVGDNESKNDEMKKLLQEFSITNVKIATNVKEAKGICERAKRIDLIIFVGMHFPYSETQAQAKIQRVYNYNENKVKINNAAQLVNDIQKYYERNEKEKPKIIVFGIGNFQKAWKRMYDFPMPRKYVQQVTFMDSLKMVLKDLL